MKKVCQRFAQSESGAVTVDWVVLTAALVGLGIGAVTAVRTGTFAMGQDIQVSLSNATVAELGFLGFEESNFVFSPFFYSEAALENYIIQFSNQSPERIQQLYDDAITRATAYITSETNLTGPHGAGEAIDAAYIFQENLRSRGLEPAPAGLTIEELSTKLRDLT
jgi:hypothetical protein